MILYCGKVIDQALELGIDHQAVLIKAYMRRGLAYERIEKYREAIDDLNKVREAQSDNK